jgi:DNA-binding winged helix-turn-helix (wHTH) protein
MSECLARSRETELNLAEIEPFALGRARVDPGHRRISWDDGHCEELEPRVMKVLVTLAQAEGHIISRDRLIHMCWDDRIVGDDAINRCVQSIRRIAKMIEPPAFHIETTPRVGYTLVAEWAPAEHRWSAASFLASDESGSSVSIRPTRLLSVGVITLALAAAALMQSRAQASDMTEIAIAGDDADGAALAGDLKVDLTQFAGSDLTDVSVVDSARGSDFVARISTTREGRLTRGNATLADGRTKDLLWSATSDSATESTAGLRAQMAAKLGNLFACASKLNSGDGHKLDTSAKRLFLAACTHIDDVADQQDIDMLRKLTAVAPEFAPGWSYLALSEAEILQNFQQLGADSSAEAVALARHAPADLRRAQSLSPGFGINFVAEAGLTAPDDWAGKGRILDQGIARDPDEYLLHQWKASLLSSVGRNADAITAASRAAELKPFSVDARVTLIWALVHAGMLPRARAELDAARGLWPGSEEHRGVWFSLELRYGDARVAQRMLDSGQWTYLGNNGETLLMQARLNPTRKNIDSLIHFAAFETGARTPCSPIRLLMLAQFGAVDESYAMIEQPAAVDALQGSTEILFRPQFAALRSDPRFLKLAARLGLLQFWRDSGNWPDFCNEPGFAYDCKTEAARLLDRIPERTS